MYKMRKEKGFKTFLVMIYKPATLSLRATVHEVIFKERCLGGYLL